MANLQIGEEKVRPANISLEPKDWNAFKALKTIYKTSSVSSLLRLFLRLWQAYNDKDLTQLADELTQEGYKPTLHGLMKKVHKENKKIEKRSRIKTEVPLPPHFKE